MPYSGDLGLFLETGPVEKSAARDPAGQPGMLERVMQPAVDMLNLLETGEGINHTVPSVPPGAIDSNDLLLVRTNQGTRTATIETMRLLMGAVSPTYPAGVLGLVGDGQTDDAPALQRACDQYAALGGATFMLRAQEGEAFYFRGTIRGGNNVQIIFLSQHKVSRNARLTLAGDVAKVANRDGFLLVSNASAGSSTLTVDTSPHGGAALSTYFAVDDTIRITGLRDSAGTAVQGQLLRITAINDGATTLTITRPLDYAYQVAYAAGDYEAAQGQTNTSGVSLVVTAQMTANVAAGASLIPVRSADIGKFAIGDHVLISAENICADIAGGSTNLTHIESAEIVASVAGDAANTVRLSRRLARAYTTAKKARLVLLEPIYNASIQGASVQFTETPDVGVAPVHPYEMRYATDCSVISCSVSNQDSFGTRGTAVKVYRSLSCTVVEPLARNARYIAAGEGYGVDFDQSTDCELEGGTFARMRHSVVFQCATNCFATSPVIQMPMHTSIDFHGSNSQGCRVISPTMSAYSNSQSDPGVAPTAIVYGNTTHLAGDHRCGVEGGRVVGFRGDSTLHNPVVLSIAGSTDCYLRDTEFNDCGQFFNHYDVAGAGTLVASGFRMEGVSVDGCLDWLFTVNGRFSGSTLNSLQDMAVSGFTARHWVRAIDLTYVTEFQLYKSIFDDPNSIDPSFTYVIDAELCPDLYVSNNVFKTNGRGIKLTNCLLFRVNNNEFADQANVTTYFDGGGNTGGWLYNLALGFTPNSTRAGSIITERPEAAGTVVMADDTAFVFSPGRHVSGMVQVWNVGGGPALYAMMQYIGIGTADSDLIAGSTTANVDRSTAVLAGTTGTDGRFTVSATNTGLIYFENRLGSSITVDFSIA